MSNPEHVESTRHHGDFWSQVPVVLFTIAAVVAIFVVNNRTQAAPRPALTPAAVDVQLAPVSCPTCGQVIAIRPAPADEVGAPGSVASGVLLDVRMSDGTVRTIRQFFPAFDVGDHVQVNGNALIARG
jgi:hypothetical protein